LTTPVIDACAKAAAGTSMSKATTTNRERTVDMEFGSFSADVGDALAMWARILEAEPRDFAAKLRQIYGGIVALDGTGERRHSRRR
jgi:hypothetical protein